MEKYCNTIDAVDTQHPTTYKPLISRYIGNPITKGFLNTESYNETSPSQ